MTTPSTYPFTKTPVDLASLLAQIAASPLITVAVDAATTSLLGPALTVGFRDVLPDDLTATASVTCQTAALAAVVAAHTGIPPAAPDAPVDNVNRPLVTLSAFAVNTDYKVRAAGGKGTAAAGTTTNIDLAVGTQDRYINGVQIIARNHVMGDTVDLEVVDKNNVLGYGAGAVLSQFGTAWNMSQSADNQGQIVFNYLARLPANTFVRVVYHSTGSVDVAVGLNLFLHQKVS